jgi:putative membrane protein
MATAQLTVLYQIGIAVAIGVLIDTFLVRSILVPAITTLVGEWAWWPSGLRLGGRWFVPAALAPGSAVLASAEAARRSPVRVAVAIVLALLVPVTFAGLITWARSGTGSPALRAAVVNGDDGTTTTAGDGTPERLRLGAELAASLAAGRSDPVSWTVEDAASAASGLTDGRYDAVLTIPAGYSRAVAAIRTDRAGGEPAPTLNLETSDASGATTQEVARALSDAVAATASRGVTASYVGDMLLAVATTHDRLSGAATTAHEIATRMATLASDAKGTRAVAGELVTGLDALASGTAGASSGAASSRAARRACQGCEAARRRGGIPRQRDGPGGLRRIPAVAGGRIARCRTGDAGCPDVRASVTSRCTRLGRVRAGHGRGHGSVGCVVAVLRARDAGERHHGFRCAGGEPRLGRGETPDGRTGACDRGLPGRDGRG